MKNKPRILIPLRYTQFKKWTAADLMRLLRRHCMKSLAMYQNNPGCKNCSQHSNGTVSFHRIPWDVKMIKKWLERIPQVNPCPVAYSCVCSDHFTSDYFKVSLMEKVTEKKRQQLLARVMPTVFSQCSPVKPHEQCKIRWAKPPKEEVSEIQFWLVNTGNQAYVKNCQNHD